MTAVVRLFALATTVTLAVSGCSVFRGEKTVTRRIVYTAEGAGEAGQVVEAPGSQTSPRAQSKARTVVDVTAPTGATGRNTASDIGVMPTSIKLGTTGWYVGAAQAVYGPALFAARSYIADLNRRGGINGRRVELKEYNADLSKPDEVLAATKKLVEEDRVFALVDTWLQSPAYGPVVPYVVDRRVPVVHGYSFTHTDKALDPWFVQFEPWQDIKGTILGGYAARTLGYRALARVFIQEFPIYRDYGDAMSRMYQRNGGRTVTTETMAVQDIANMDPIISKLRASGADSVWFGFSVACVAGVQSARRQGWNVPFLCTDTFGQLAIDGGGPPADGILTTTSGNAFAEEGVVQTPELERFKRITHEFYPDLEWTAVTEGAWTGMLMFEYAARRLGPNLTRAGMKEIFEDKVRSVDTGMGPLYTCTTRQRFCGTGDVLIKIDYSRKKFVRVITDRPYSYPSDF